MQAKRKAVGSGLKRRMDAGWTGRLGWIAMICLVPMLLGGIDPATRDALKVQHILKAIAARAKKNPAENANRQAAVTEDELNAYIAYRLAREKDPMIHGLKLMLMENNRVRGHLRILLSGNSLLALLGSDLSFDFDGILHSRDGAGRIDLSALSLNGQAVPPQTLDAVLAAVAQYYGQTPGSINDWYALPDGVKRITAHKSKLILDY